MKHIIAVLLENEPGALSRVVGLFSARGYNIESLTVAPTEDPSLSRMTIVTTGSDDVIEQITKHLNRLIEVVKVVDLTEGAYTERELMMVKVRAVGKEREEMKRMAEIFRGRIIDVTEKSYTIELTGDQARTTPSWKRSTVALSSRLSAPVPAASGAASASCACRGCKIPSVSSGGEGECKTCWASTSGYCISDWGVLGLGEGGSWLPSAIFLYRSRDLIA
jgi:acetolactate synthase-1/3 small subunit